MYGRTDDNSRLGHTPTATDTAKKQMNDPNEIWSALGELPEAEAMHVLSKLFFAYEAQLSTNNEDQEALNFFRTLGKAIELTTQCNLNRR